MYFVVQLDPGPMLGYIYVMKWKSLQYGVISLESQLPFLETAMLLDTSMKKKNNQKTKGHSPFISNDTFIVSFSGTPYLLFPVFSSTV